MPPVPFAGGAKEKEKLHAKFSAAATALADLYRESSNSYEAGYRDALLFVQRYLQTRAPATVAPSSMQPSSASSVEGELPPPPPSTSTPAPGVCATVNAAQMLRFLQDTAAARRERMAVVRGVSTMRRRQRDSHSPSDNPRRGNGTSGANADAYADFDNDDVTEEEDEEGEENEEREAPGLTPQLSPASGPQMLAIAAPVETAESVLSREMELITHLEPHATAETPPRQPLRQRRRTDRVSSTLQRSYHQHVHTPREHSLSSQLRIQQGK